jgi:hypothetical protein
MVPTLQTTFPGFICPNAPNDMIAAIGAGGQFLNVIPSQNLVWLRMGDEPGNSLVPFMLNDAIWEYVNDLSCSLLEIEEDNLSEIKVFPNPASSYITIDANDIKLGKIMIYNSVGMVQQELSSDLTTLNLDISAFENGLYFISFPDKKITLRFVK